jgi:hypothetical protein
MNRECGRQTLYFALQGCFEAIDPDLTKVLRRVHSKCPGLFSNLTSHVFDANIKYVDYANSQGISSDPKHIDAAAQLRIPEKNLDKNDGWLSVTYINKLNTRHSFIVSLLSAYLVDYGKRNLNMFNVSLAPLSAEYTMKTVLT